MVKIDPSGGPRTPVRGGLRRLGAVGDQWNEGRSIHVGLDRVDDDLYSGWLPALACAGNDARAMRGLADELGFASRLLVNEEATRGNVVDCLSATIERLVEGDVLMVTYAGHMTKLAGVGSDDDGWDEAWCLFDGVVLDDEIHDLLSDIPAGVDVLAISDSCFAGGDLDATATVIAPGTFAPALRTKRAGLAGMDPSGGADLTVLHRARADAVAARSPSVGLGDAVLSRLVHSGALPYGPVRPAARRRAIVARVVALCAAAEGTLAYEGAEHGLFTAALLEAAKRFRGQDISYGELMESVCELLRCQSPTIGVYGAADASSAQATAFQAGSDRPRRHVASAKRFGVTGPGGPEPSKQ